MNIEQEVLHAYEEFQQAMITKDIPRLRELVSSDKTFTHMSGKKQTREEFFAEIKNGILNYYKYNVRNVNVTVQDDVVILDADTTLTAKVYGMKGTWTLHNTICYRKINGSWIQCNG